MIRSILSISSRQPSPPFPFACGALPQPRSRMALAADTRAAGVASSDRMTPNRTLSAALVWLRASERISVTALAIFDLASFETCPDIYARPYVSMIRHIIAGPCRLNKKRASRIRSYCAVGAARTEWSYASVERLPHRNGDEGCQGERNQRCGHVGHLLGRK